MPSRTSGATPGKRSRAERQAADDAAGEDDPLQQGGGREELKGDPRKAFMSYYLKAK